MRPRLVFSLIVALLIALFGSDARASGLVAPVVPDANADAAAPTAVSALATLRSLSVDATLGSQAADLVEHRTYGLAASYSGQTATVTFYYSVTEKWTGAPSVVVAGQARTGTLLTAADADALRRRLTLDLHDPSPLRDLGSPLFVSDPIDLMVPAGGAVDVSITTTVPLAAVGTLQGVVVPIDWSRSPVATVTANVTAKTDAPLRALYSPYHDLAVVRDGTYQAHATYSGQQVCTDFDLTLLVSSGDGLVQLDFVPFRYGQDEGGYFLSLVTTDPRPITENVLPRDIVLVLDTSGSMAGIKITQAKEALRGVLGGLKSDDSFALITFSDAVKSFQPAAVKATAANVASAIAFVSDIQANGGTNIYDALQGAFAALPRETGHPRYVVFLTDGQPTVGQTGVDAIAAMAQAQNDLGARIFSFGIGDDVNTVLLDRLATQSSGAAIYIRPTESVTTAVQDFFGRIADPVLANPTLELDGFDVSTVYPEVMPDLFAGGVVTLFGRYARPGRANVALNGQRNGLPWSTVVDVTLPAYQLDGGYVPRIWALRRVGKLLAQIKQGNTDPTLVEQALATATRFGVTTQFTYFALDKAGDVRVSYSAVPVTAVGSVAVDTSTKLNGYGSSNSVSTTANVAVRYVADRSLPVQAGYLTDTKLVDGTSFVDLSFGSDAYFAFAAAERSFGAAGLVAAGANTRLELLGRDFRVTDPSAPASSSGPIPTPTATIPAPGWRPVGDMVTAATVTDAGATGGGGLDGGGAASGSGGGGATAGATAGATGGATGGVTGAATAGANGSTAASGGVVSPQDGGVVGPGEQVPTSLRAGGGGCACAIGRARDSSGGESPGRETPGRAAALTVGLALLVFGRLGRLGRFGRPGRLGARVHRAAPRRRRA